MHFLDGGDGTPDAGHDLGRELEAQIHALGADMEQEISGGRDRMARAAAKFAERMELGRARRAEQPVPRLRTDSHHAGQAGLDVAKLDRPQQRRQVRA